MQRATDRKPPERRGDEDELYRRHHRDLQGSVIQAVRAPKDLIEDACQSAWAILLCTQPDRRAIFAWLRVVAIHEAYRLLAIERREARQQPIRRHDHDRDELAADTRSLDDAVEALEALRALASLPERQRDDLALRLAGYTYEEIRARTRGRTMTNVTKSLRKARARVRRS